VLKVEAAVPKGNYCTVGEIAGTLVPFEDWLRFWEIERSM